MIKEKPILFKDEMIRAILEGRKTQTRRAVKSPAKNMQASGAEVIKRREPGDKWYGDRIWSMRGGTGVWGDYTHERFLSMCPYGKPGDRLWVRETWAAHFIWEPCAPSRIPVDEGSCLFYRADEFCRGGCDEGQRGKWRPSIHMPRRISRITLEIADVRVERLHDISAEDAKAEGVEPFHLNGWCDDQKFRGEFYNLWMEINGPDSWDANPWVWAIEFKQVTP